MCYRLRSVYHIRNAISGIASYTVHISFRYIVASGRHLVSFDQIATPPSPLPSGKSRFVESLYSLLRMFLVLCSCRRALNMFQTTSHSTNSHSSAKHPGMERSRGAPPATAAADPRNIVNNWNLQTEKFNVLLCCLCIIATGYFLLVWYKYMQIYVRRTTVITKTTVKIRWRSNWCGAGRAVAPRRLLKRLHVNHIQNFK